VNSEVKQNKAVLVSYIPVVHTGYLKFFAKHSEIKELWLIGKELAYELRSLQKDIRAISPEEIKLFLETLKIFDSIKILTPQNLNELQSFNGDLMFSDEDISHHLTQKYFAKNQVVFDSTFLRWDLKSSLKENDLANYSGKLSNKILQTISNLLENEKTRSDDWWRQVGAVAIKNNKVVLSSHNHHVPTEYETVYEGDPRANFHKGEYLKVSTAIHAEAILIAKAAKQGISLDKAELFVTTFPCPVCAKQIAYSGIKKVYFIDGYSVLDGEKILKDNDVEIEKISI